MNMWKKSEFFNIILGIITRSWYFSFSRMLIHGQNKAADLTSLFMVKSVAAAFKSLLRPSETFHDKVPADRLQSVITENIITDVDKVKIRSVTSIVDYSQWLMPLFSSSRGHGLILWCYPPSESTSDSLWRIPFFGDVLLRLSSNTLFNNLSCF